MFTKEEIAKGLTLAQRTRPTWPLKDLTIDQLYEAIVRANQAPANVEGLNPSNMPRYF